MKAINSRQGENYIEYINRILKSRPNKKIEKGQHRHHIIPKSLGGDNSSDNLIWLFASEHAKVHYLYSIEHPDCCGMIYAARTLCSKNGELLTDDEINWLSKHNAELQSKRVMGENNPMYGKHHSEESRRKNAEKQKGRAAGKNNPMYGVHLRGEKHPRFGKIVSQEQREKQSKAMKGKMIGEKNPRAIKVKCINTQEIFLTLNAASKWCNLKSSSSITDSIKKTQKTGKKKSAGKHPITKEKLYWEYVE